MFVTSLVQVQACEETDACLHDSWRLEVAGDLWEAKLKRCIMLLMYARIIVLCMEDRQWIHVLILNSNFPIMNV